MKVTRRHAREVALQILFQHDLNPLPDRAMDEAFAAERLKYPELEQFAMSLVDGVREHWREIDRELKSAGSKWSIDRMATLDRTVLRLAVYEIKYAGTPPKVAVNEAIDLSRKFSNEESTAFVNGVLDAVAGLGGRRNQEAPSASEPQTTAPTDEASST